MNANQLYTFYDSGTSKTSSFVPALTTGTQPPSQGSSIAANLPEGTEVAHFALPTPNGLPFHTTQNQKYPVTANASAPWVAVPACNAGKRPAPARGLGLVRPGIASLNLPSRAPVSTLAQRVRAYTY